MNNIKSDAFFLNLNSIKVRLYACNVKDSKSRDLLLRSELNLTCLHNIKPFYTDSGAWNSLHTILCDYFGFASRFYLAIFEVSTCDTFMCYVCIIDDDLMTVKIYFTGNGFKFSITFCSCWTFGLDVFVGLIKRYFQIVKMTF